MCFFLFIELYWTLVFNLMKEINQNQCIETNKKTNDERRDESKSNKSKQQKN